MSTPEPPSPQLPTPEQADAIAYYKQEILLLKEQVLGGLEMKMILLMTLVEQTQKSIEDERKAIRLLVRDKAGLLTPEEQQQLDEWIHKPEALGKVLSSAE